MRPGLVATATNSTARQVQRQAHVAFRSGACARENWERGEPGGRTPGLPPAGASALRAATEARPRPVAAGRLRLNGGTMKLIPHHQDDKHGTREYRSSDGAWRVVQTRRPGGSRNARPRWEVHERCEGRGAGWRHHAAFERRRDALVFLDTTAPAGESVTAAPLRRPETPEPSQESPQSGPRPTRKGPTTSTRPALRTSRGRCAACSCTIRGRSRRRASRRPAGSASGSGRRPATGNARAAMKAAKKET